ncbi:MAG: coenzyme F420 hydrogenase [Spirochaetaceae bacterium]|nr:coenzyme F420 hydrogenase [Spirochaetaceae bacterium]
MEIDAAALKSKGFFQQAQKDKFSLRLCFSGGTIDTDCLRKAVEIADKYGNEQIHFTTRQQIEIPHIAAENVESVQKLLSESGIKTFIGGPRVRTVVACMGAAVCKFGQIDTFALAKEIHDRYFGRELPAKLKIALTGCKNNCAKVEASDIGVRGVKDGYQLYFGGCFGHETRIGTPILPVLAEKEKVLDAIDRTINFFADNAVKGERLGRLLDRVGIDQFKKTLE